MILNLPKNGNLRPRFGEADTRKRPFTFLKTFVLQIDNLLLRLKSCGHLVAGLKMMDNNSECSKNPQNRNQFFQSLFSFLLKGHLSRKEAERFLIMWLRNLQRFQVKYLTISS